MRIRLGNHETSNTTGRTNYKKETVSDYNYAIRDSLSHYTAAIQRGLFSLYSSCCGGQRPLIGVEGRRHGGDRVRKCAVFLKCTGALNIVNGTKNPRICHLIPSVVVYRVSGIEIHSENGKIPCPQKMWGWHEKRILRVRRMEKQIVNKLTLSKYYYRAYLRGYALLMGILMYSKFRISIKNHGFTLYQCWKT